MIKIYFACSIRGGGDTKNYEAITSAIKSHATLLTEIFINDAIVLGGSPLASDEIYRRDTDWILEADAVIAEVSNPSLGVGYELAFAETHSVPVLALFDETSGKKLSAMIEGNSYFEVEYYTSQKHIKSLVETFINKI